MTNPLNPTAEMIRSIRLKIYDDLLKGHLNHTVALQTLGRYVEVANRIGDQVLVGQLYDMMGIICGHSGRLRDGIAYYQQALAIFENLGDEMRIGRTHNNLGESYVTLGDYEAARLAFQTSAQHMEQAEDFKTLPMVKCNLGYIQLVLGDLEQAEQAFQHVTAQLLAQDVHDIPMINMQTYILVNRGAGEIALRRGSYSVMWGHFAKALEAAQASHLSFDQALVYLHFAHGAVVDRDHQGNTPQGYYQLAEKLLKQEQAPTLLARLYLEEARYQHRFGEIELGRQFARQAHQIFAQQDMSDESSLATALL